MSKLKKVLLMCTAYVLVAALAIGGTIAYLQDSDSDVNVMTLGNVSIEQIEQQKNEAGELEPFEQAKELYPGTEISKIVTVKNTGKSDAYFRTLVAFEDIESDTFEMGFPISENGYRWSWGAPEATIVVDGVTYQVYEAVYSKVLIAGETSPASLTKVEFGSSCTNEDMEALGGTYEILVLSQAVQAAGFADAKTALDTAFGDVTDATAAEWFGGIAADAPVVVSTSEELTAALKNGKPVVLDADIELDAALTVEKIANIDLNGHTLATKGLDLTAGGEIADGTITSNGNTNMVPHLKISGGNVELNNVVVDVKHHLNANVYWSEATGLEIMNATAVLNDCDVKIHNGTNAQWVYSYGISINNANVTVNGGSIVATCVNGTAANGPTNPNAISSMGACEITLNSVDVTATYYATTVNGHLTINTTDKDITSSNIVDNRGGSHTVNYID